MTRRIYPRPPIVEAVIDLRFASSVSRVELIEVLDERLGGQYAGAREPRDRAEASTSAAEEAVATSALRPHITFLRSSDGLRQLGCGDATLSVHVLAPYPGWESFFEQAQEAVEALPLSAREGGLVRLAVRYVDRIVLPSTDVAFDDFLTIMPGCPPGMPRRLSSFHVVTHTVDPEDGTEAMLTTASVPPDDEGPPALIYDLNVQRRGAPLCDLLGNEWAEIAQTLHERQREIFEASITDGMRGLFQ